MCTAGTDFISVTIKRILSFPRDLLSSRRNQMSIVHERLAYVLLIATFRSAISEGRKESSNHAVTINLIILM